MTLQEEDMLLQEIASRSNQTTQSLITDIITGQALFPCPSHTEESQRR